MEGVYTFHTFEPVDPILLIAQFCKIYVGNNSNNGLSLAIIIRPFTPKLNQKIDIFHNLVVVFWSYLGLIIYGAQIPVFWSFEGFEVVQMFGHCFLELERLT